jgi:hypothetical protein
METPMTKEQALAMLSDAEGYIWATVPPRHFISEHPVEQATIFDLQRSQKALRLEIRATIPVLEEFPTYNDLRYQ